MTRLLASSTDHALKAGVSRGCRTLAGGGVAQVHQGKPRVAASPSLRGRHPEGDRTPGLMVWMFAEEALKLLRGTVTVICPVGVSGVQHGGRCPVTLLAQAWTPPHGRASGAGLGGLERSFKDRGS